MKVQPEAFTHILKSFRNLSLLTETEAGQVTSMLTEEFPLSAVIDHADSIHVHVKVDDTTTLPHDKIQALGTIPENEATGYVKYPFAGGINVILSSIPIADDDLIPGLQNPPLPFMDHTGIDLRTERPPVLDLFRAIPAVATDQGWRHVGQGSAVGGKPVYCCHTEVQGKYWVYPPPDSGPAFTRPIEVAIGELIIRDQEMGCDLRPLDPAHPMAGRATCAGTPAGPQQIALRRPGVG